MCDGIKGVVYEWILGFGAYFSWSGLVLVVEMGAGMMAKSQCMELGFIA